VIGVIYALPRVVDTLRLRFSRVDSWPRLAWLARCRPSSGIVDVLHGPNVETATDWFSEAVWDAAFEDGAFDRTDVVFGSGGRIRGGSVTFVSSGATVDRLQTLMTNGEVLVSNSLPCLLAVGGARVDPRYPHYFRDFSSIRFGLSRYTPLLATSAGSARLMYYHNATWDGNRLQMSEKPRPIRDFGTFERYRRFMESTLQRIGENLASPLRANPFRPIGTISSGYDSPTVAVLARPAGLREVISIVESRDEGSDSGREVAGYLGLSVMLVDRDAWRTKPFVEVPFLAADAKGEDVLYSAAEEKLKGAVLITGYQGDKIWGKYETQLGSDLVRSDQSGLSMTEYRLRTGYVHVPVPFIAERQIADINKLSRSPAMARWDVGEGDYTRPICRRIVEGAGVPRDAFAIRKKAATWLFFRSSSFLTPEALADYLPWLEANIDTRHQPDRWRTALRSGVGRAAQVFESVASPGGTAVAFLTKGARRVAIWADREPKFRWLFPWAMERAMLAYS
jgi:hypothetical protein